MSLIISIFASSLESKLKFNYIANGWIDGRYPLGSATAADDVPYCICDEADFQAKDVVR